MADVEPGRSRPHSPRQGVPLTPSNVMREMREVRDWLGERGLGYWLLIPRSKREEIRQKFPDEMEQKKQLISHWVNTDPLASWRRLIRTLDAIEETRMADSIRSYAEPLTDDSLTPHTLLPAVSSVRHFWRRHDDDDDEWGLLERLGVPWSVMGGIMASPSHSTEEEKRIAGLQYYLQTLPGASWEDIAGALWFMEEHTALEEVRQHLPRTYDPSLTPSNMRAALDTLPADKWEWFGGGLAFPQSKLDQINSQFTSDEERKDEVIRIYHTQHPHPTWEHVSDALYRCGDAYPDQQFHNVLYRLQSTFPMDESSVCSASDAPPTPETKSLGINDLFSVCSELVGVAYKWKMVGLALRLDPNFLNGIEAKKNDFEGKLSGVLEEWLKKCYDTESFGDPSWKLLVDAVAHPVGGRDRALAMEIAAKYNVPPPQ